MKNVKLTGRITYFSVKLCYTNIYFSHTQLSTVNILPLLKLLQVLALFFHFQKTSFQTADPGCRAV